MPELHDVDWQALSVPQAPEWLEGLRSSDAETRKAAFDALDDLRLFGLHRSAPALIPFLIDTLRRPIPTPEQPLLLLMQFADDASVPDHAPCELCDDVLRELSGGIDVYLTYALSDEPALSAIVTALLGYLADDAGRIVTALIALLPRAGTTARVRLLAAIDALMSHRRTDPAVRDLLPAPYLEVLFVTAEDDALKRAAAVLLARSHRAALPAQIETYLVESAIRGWRSICEILSDLGVERGSAALLRVLASIHKLDYTVETAAQLLDVLFYGQVVVGRSIQSVWEGNKLVAMEFYSAREPDAPRPIASLSETQRDALRQLLELDRLWDIRHNAFSQHGLPDTRDDLAALLGS